MQRPFPRAIDMPNLLRKTGWVVAWFVIFDIAGVALSLFLDLVSLVDRHWETSAALGYVIWFVVGVFCAAIIYGQVVGVAWDSAEGRRQGTQATIITAGVALALGLLASLVWSGSEGTEAVVPDHRGITITYLVTVVLAVCLARFVVFRDTSGDRPDLAGPARDELLSVGAGAGSVRETEPFVPKGARFLRSSRPGGLPWQPGADDDPDSFRPSGFWGTVGFVLGVPVLLFLDVSFFLLAPFDYFDRWTDPLLTGAIVGGLAWGFAAARWYPARVALMAVHAPLICGTIFYVFALLIGGLLVAFGVPERFALFVSAGGFWIGFLVGCVVAFAGYLEIFGRPATAGQEGRQRR